MSSTSRSTTSSARRSSSDYLAHLAPATKTCYFLPGHDEPVNVVGKCSEDLGTRLLLKVTPDDSEGFRAQEIPCVVEEGGSYRAKLPCGFGKESEIPKSTSATVEIKAFYDERASRLIGMVDMEINCLTKKKKKSFFEVAAQQQAVFAKALQLSKEKIKRAQEMEDELQNEANKYKEEMDATEKELQELAPVLLKHLNDHMQKQKRLSECQALYNNCVKKVKMEEKKVAGHREKLSNNSLEMFAFILQVAKDNEQHKED